MKNILAALILLSLSKQAYTQTAADPEAKVDPKTGETLATRSAYDPNACYGPLPEVRDPAMEELARKAESRRKERGTEGEK